MGNEALVSLGVRPGSRALAWGGWDCQVETMNRLRWEVMVGSPGVSLGG